MWGRLQGGGVGFGVGYGYRDLMSYPYDGVDLRDRKSTRLNSSHANISYAVFCLKKKKKSPFLRISPTLLDLSWNGSRRRRRYHQLDPLHLPRLLCVRLLHPHLVQS